MRDSDNKMGQELEERRKLSTLELWQSHITALSHINNKDTHSTDGSDTEKETSSIVKIEQPDNSTYVDVFI